LIAVPAEAGTHQSAPWVVEKWTPAFAGDAAQISSAHIVTLHGCDILSYLTGLTAAVAPPR